MQQKHTILIIDDDCIELDILSTVLSSAGYRVLIAEDGETGVHRAIFAQPDLILLDIIMPAGIDGFEVCRKLRGNKRTNDIPIFFKTCQSDDQTKIDGFHKGIDDYILKPSNHDELLYKIKCRLSVNRVDYLKTRLSPFPQPQPLQSAL